MTCMSKCENNYLTVERMKHIVVLTLHEAGHLPFVTQFN